MWGDVDLLELAEDLYSERRRFDRDRGLAAAAIMEGIGRLPLDGQKALLERAAALQLTPERRAMLLGALAMPISAEDPAWLMEFCFPGPGQGRARLWLDHDRVSTGLLEVVGKFWVQRDASGATEWLVRALEEQRFGKPEGRNGSSLTDFVSVIATQTWPISQAEVEAMLSYLSGGRTQVLQVMAKELEGNVDLAALANSSLIPQLHGDQSRIYSSIGSRFRARDWRAAKEFLDGIIDRRVRREVMLGAVRGREELGRGRMGEGVEIEKIVAWVEEEIAEEDAAFVIGGLLGTDSFLDIEGMWMQATQVASELGYGEELLAAYLAHVGPEHNPVHVLEQAVEVLSDPQLKADVGYHAIASLMGYTNHIESQLESAGFEQPEIELVLGRFGQ